ncbi:MAG: DUF481 domain-containing protein [Candidatus Omnitrophica bacterium]|nr:DUF481 domain-containing protein [Candidatus Omnitrophota bacterium]
MAPAWGLEVYLKNGDKLSGVLVREDAASLALQTQAAGEIQINKDFIDLPKTFPERYTPPRTTPPAPAVVWKKDLSLGYTQNGGNTKSQLGQFSGSLDRKTPANEATVKLESTYSSSKNIMSGKKFYGLLRYAFSFGPQLKWYNFYKMEGNQDYFADIYYRIDPSVGVGYWFSSTPELKAMAELGVGYQYTAYRVETKSDNGQVILVPRFFIDKHLIGNLHLTEDFTYYPSLENFSNYRFRSETDLVSQIAVRWALKVGYTDDYNSAPPPGFKKNDYISLTSLEYHF